MRAAHYFKLSADQNRADGQFYYGRCLFEGRAVGVDCHGMAELGITSENVRGTRKDHKCAVEWYKAGAKAGNAEAQGHLRFCLQYGLGCEADLKASLEWYQQSADEGNIESRLSLSSLLQYGIGCEVDLDDSADYGVMNFDISIGIRSSDGYRCVRALGKSKFPRTRLISKSESKATRVESSTRRHPHVRSTSISDYLDNSRTTQNGPLIGYGGSSTVSLERKVVTGELIAVKRFREVKFDQTTFIREVEALIYLNHPCVVQIFGYKLPIGREPAEIRTAVAENGSVKDILEKVGYGTQFRFWNSTGKGILICGIAMGMRFIHSKGIIHGDLKPSNILVNFGGEGLMSDFGLSCFEKDDYTLTAGGGTVNYAAPELFNEDTRRTRKVDIYGFGLLMYEILTGTAVFASSKYAFPIMKRILAGEMPSVPSECGSFMQELIARCWSMDPDKRPTFDEIINDFKSARFQIVPGAEAEKLGLYVADLEKWEKEETVQSHLN
jgi:serine/threonine protein kinase/TPR repeat protein